MSQLLMAKSDICPLNRMRSGDDGGSKFVVSYPERSAGLRGWEGSWLR